MSMTQPQADLSAFLSGHQPDSREASFDYCYNYFQTFREAGRPNDLLRPEHLPQACLQVGFYLASWGMFRNSFLLNRSAHHFIPLIKTIAATPEEVWAIDVGRYTPENIERLRQTERQIAKAVTEGVEAAASVTLSTKIMLGVFGNVPALDYFVGKGLLAEQGVNPSTLNNRALEKIEEYYQTHRPTFESQRIHTLDFLTGRPTARLYPQAKLVDMALFMRGQRPD